MTVCHPFPPTCGVAVSVLGLGTDTTESGTREANTTCFIIGSLDSQALQRRLQELDNEAALYANSRVKETAAEWTW